MSEEIYNEIPNDHLIRICQYRHGSTCCKYIVFFERIGKFCCVKSTSKWREKIDRQTDELKARGDNCEGLSHETQ